jgi:hypothetical protein
MAGSSDRQILWIVLLASLFWLGVWRHDTLEAVWHKTAKAVVEMAQGH